MTKVYFIINGKVKLKIYYEKRIFFRLQIYLEYSPISPKNNQ